MIDSGGVRVVGDGSYLSAGEAADLLGLGHNTVSRMFDEGTLTGHVTERGRHRRIDPASVARVLLARPAGAQRDAALQQLRESGVNVDGLAAE